MDRGVTKHVCNRELPVNNIGSVHVYKFAMQQSCGEMDLIIVQMTTIKKGDHRYVSSPLTVRVLAAV